MVALQGVASSFIPNKTGKGGKASFCVVDYDPTSGEHGKNTRLSKELEIDGDAEKLCEAWVTPMMHAAINNNKLLKRIHKPTKHAVPASTYWPWKDKESPYADSVNDNVRRSFSDHTDIIRFFKDMIDPTVSWIQFNLSTFLGQHDIDKNIFESSESVFDPGEYTREMNLISEPIKIPTEAELEKLIQEEVELLASEAVDRQLFFQIAGDPKDPIYQAHLAPRYEAKLEKLLRRPVSVQLPSMPVNDPGHDLVRPRLVALADRIGLPRPERIYQVRQ